MDSNKLRLRAVARFTENRVFALLIGGPGAHRIISAVEDQVVPSLGEVFVKRNDGDGMEAAISTQLT